jgi:2-methylcitrate dehydratase PrpD
MSPSEATRQLASFVSATRPGDLGPAADKLALDLLVDAVGVGIAGERAADFAPLADYSRECAGSGPVPAPGGLDRDPGQAAFLYGAAIHILDYDDIVPELGHSAAVLVSAALAAGYVVGASGPEVVTAVAVGAEVGSRLGLAANPGLYTSGWHPTAVLGAVAAAAAAASVLRLDERRAAHALGLAGTLASGMKASIGSTAKCMQVGAAARTGVEAALMARAGVQGNPSLFDPQFGAYFELFAPDADRPAITAELGSRSEFVRQGVRLKFLPCCGSIHSPVFATLDVVARNGIKPAEIARIATEVDRNRLPHTDRLIVRTALAGKFSMQYCQAVAALTGGLVLGDFTQDAVLEPARQDLMARVELRAAEMPAGGPSTGSRAARVTVTTTAGESFTSFVAAPKGTKENPANDADLDRKFLDCVGEHRGPDEAERLLRALRAVADITDVRPLVTAIWPGTAAPATR